MCGIMGYVGTESAPEILLNGLRRLEYRGYDSTGIALFQNGKVDVFKSVGKLAETEALFKKSSPVQSSIGIGHTRWATHGAPSTVNAHPHQVGRVVIVHNGIVENESEIRKEAIAAGFQPTSETDSELLGYLIDRQLAKGLKFPDAVRAAFERVRGACTMVATDIENPGELVGVQMGPPLVITENDHGSFLASDSQALLQHSKEMVFLDSGEMAIVTAKGCEVLRLKDGRVVKKETHVLDWDAEQMDKQGYSHYMLKEIHEQPAAWFDTLNELLTRKADGFAFADHPGLAYLEKAKRIRMVACGTSWHAALLGKYWIEAFAEIPVEVELASEFRYRKPVLTEGEVLVAISQSGETADTLSVVREFKQKGFSTVGLTNVKGSSLSREATACFYTVAGPEIGVAATKTFTSQMLVNLLWAFHMAKQPSVDLFQALVKIPHQVNALLAAEECFFSEIRKAAENVQDAKGFFFMGRGLSFPLALEGALKLKEIAYLHAEGYAGGELKHGPIAMIDRGMVVVVIAPQDPWRDKTVSNLQEVKARGARILGIGTEGDSSFAEVCDDWIQIPKLEKGLYCLDPFLIAPVLQVLSFEIALLKETDIDQPRNLAKSVTVE